MNPDIVELLKQVGLTQYEAEAYSSLLREGPLTGYELGKRSRVPLPRSYDVLERLVERGLALVQPGDPPRYLAEDRARFLGRLRHTMTARLDELEAALMALSPPDGGEELWVVRGGEQIQHRIAAMIGAAEHTVDLHLPAPLRHRLDTVLAEAGSRGCRVSALRRTDLGEAVLALIDGGEVLAGTLAPDAQAVVTRNRALVAMARTYFASVHPTEQPLAAGAALTVASDWLAWEDEKHRRLRLLAGGSDVA